MANALLIEKQNGGYFKFTLNGDTANAITSIQNDLLAVGGQLHFKTGNGANIIKEQSIYPADLTIIAAGTFTFTTVAAVWNKLIEVGYFDWLGGGVGGVDRFDELLDTFQYTGNAGKALIVDDSELKLVPITLYNKRLFTELEDVPNDLVPDKMVVVNSAGTALILKDQPEPPEEYLNSVGYFDYNDLATQTTPLNAVANVALKLTNDTEGANTSTDQNPYGVSYVWDYTTNQFNFSELEVGDTIDVRVHLQITTTTSNQKVSLKAKFGIGSVSQFENAIYENQFKSSGLHEVSFVAPFYMGSTDITDYPAELYLTTDASATVKVDGWYVRILRKNINIITVDYQVEDATPTVKGILRLAGDLSGTANNPTVPALANKVNTSRNINTTSPLLGGGNLSTDLTLSIQQANSTQSGFVNNVDWAHFEAAYYEKIDDISITGTTTKTLTLTQHDGSTLSANWTDDNSVTSVFGRTGAVVAVSGDYTTSLVTESANKNYQTDNQKLYNDATSSIQTQLNSKQPNLSGTGIVKSVGGTISYLTDNTANWDDAYNNKITTAAVTGTTTKTLTLTQQDGGTVEASWTDSDTAVTIGTPANGLSLSGQVLSLSVAHSLNTGALSSTDWTTFNNKQNALNGTGFVKVSGTTVSYDNSTYALDSVVVKLTGDQTIEGAKTFTGAFKTSIPSLTGGQTKISAIEGISDGYVIDVDVDDNMSHTFNRGDGVPAMFIAPSGSVTVGGTAAVAKFSVIGSMYAGSMFFNGGNISTFGTTSPLSFTVNNSPRLYINTSGNIGIGLTNPSNKLEVVGAIMASLEANHTVAFKGSSIFLDQANSDLSRIAFLGPNTSTYGAIEFFQSNSSASMFRSAMRITSDGNVGIGTTSPSSLLHLSGSSTSPITHIIENNNAGTSAGTKLSLRYNGVETAYLYNRFNGGDFNTDLGSADYFRILTAGSERMRITSGGNVLIGRTTDDGGGQKLQINGSILLNGFGVGNETGIFFREGAASSYKYNVSILAYDHIDGGSSPDGISINGYDGVSICTGSNTRQERMRVTLNGRVLVNTTTGIGQEQFCVNFDSNSGISQAINIKDTYASANNAAYIVFRKNDDAGIGSISRIGTTSAVAYNTTSDYRLKEDFKQIKGLDLVSKIKVYDFKWKDNDARMDGVIAHELQKVVPYAVTGQKDDKEFQSVDYSKLVPILVQAIQELQDKINKLENK